MSTEHNSTDETVKPPIWGEILRRYRMPENVAAYLDWATGIIRINTSSQKWLGLIARQEDQATFSNEELILLETVTHEVTHFFQIITCGYLYQFASNLHSEIRDWIVESEKTFQGSTKDRVLNLLNAPIPVSVAERIRNITTNFNAPGPDGLTVRAIVESAALLVQKRTFRQDLSDKTYRIMLDQTPPPPEYRSAYDVANKYLGDDTLDVFPYLTSLALCTDDPPRTLVMLCQGVAKLGLASGGIIKSGAIASLLFQEGIGVMGTASEVAVTLPEHPVYTAALIRVNELQSEGLVSLDDYMITPHLVIERLADEAIRPMVFNDESRRWSVTIPPQLWPDLSDEDADGKMSGLIVIGAIYARVLDDYSV